MCSSSPDTLASGWFSDLMLTAHSRPAQGAITGQPSVTSKRPDPGLGCKKPVLANERRHRLAIWRWTVAPVRSAAFRTGTCSCDIPVLTPCPRLRALRSRISLHLLRLPSRTKRLVGLDDTTQFDRARRHSPPEAGRQREKPMLPGGTAARRRAVFTVVAIA